MPLKVGIVPEVESFASSFERARAERPAGVSVAEFLPQPGHPEYAEIGLELLRIDLELGWSDGRPTSLEEYRQRFPDILDEPARFERLAFEEYRQRCDARQDVAPSEYAEQYGVNVRAWPGVASASVGTSWPSTNDLPTSGRVFNDFEIVEELGSGAFARVFLARQTSLAHRQVALKISRGYSVEPDRLAQLQHANIVPVFSVHQADGLQGLCMPYLGRHTLAHVIEHTRSAGCLPRSGRDLLTTIVAGIDSTKAPALLPARQESAPRSGSPIAASIRERFEGANYVDSVVWIAARLADGLAHAHERGVLHRDLKPANVLFSDDGRPMLLDFNLSEDVKRANGYAQAVGGTLPYMSPEQLESLADGAAVDVRSDVYSLGVILFELLTGQLPFAPPASAQPDSVAAAVVARWRGAISVRAMNSAVPRSMAAVVARCLAPEPANRYQSASQLREDLDRHLEHRPLAHAPDRSPGERARKWVRRHPRIASAAGIGLAASLAIIVMSAVWISREGHFGRVEAANFFREFSSRLDDARLPLSVPGLDVDAHAGGVAQARELLNTYAVLDNLQLRQTPAYLNLGPERQQRLDRDLISLLHALTAASLKLSATEQDSKRREQALNDAQEYNSTALNLAGGAAPQFPVLTSHRQLIARIRGGRPVRLAEITDSFAPLATAEGAACRFLHNGQYAEALPLLVEWRDSQPTNIAAWMLLGVAYAGIGNSVDAEECFTTCTRLRPQYAFSYFQRGLARHQQQKYQEAADDFGRYMELRGVSPAALINRSLAYEALGELKAALRDLDAALATGARQTRIYFIRSSVRQKLNDVAGAKEDFEQGLALTPTDATSWLARGMAQLKNSPQRALADFRQALRLEPGNRLASQNILHVLSDRLHRDEEAVEVLAGLIEANPADSKALLTRGMLYARQGAVENAIADTTAGLNIDDDPLSVLQASCAFAQISKKRQEHRDAALRLLAEALGAEPTLVAIASIDADLEPLRETEEFERILKAADVIREGGGTANEEATAAR